MYIKYYVNEGRKYKVGDVKLSGNKIFTDAEILNGLHGVHDFEHSKAKLGVHGLPMDSGDMFTPDGLTKDTDLIEDFYGSKGYIEISEGRALQKFPIMPGAGPHRGLDKNHLTASSATSISPASAMAISGDGGRSD